MPPYNFNNLRSAWMVPRPHTPILYHTSSDRLAQHNTATVPIIVRLPHATGFLNHVYIFFAPWISVKLFMQPPHENRRQYIVCIYALLALRRVSSLLFGADADQWGTILVVCFYNLYNELWLRLRRNNVFSIMAIVISDL
jgi:hypothetical protein